MGSLKVCGACGTARTLLPAEHADALLNLLSPLLTDEYPRPETVCAICSKKVDMLIATMHDIRKKYILTQTLLRHYYDKAIDVSWAEYRNSSVANAIENSEFILKEFDRVKTIYFDSPPKRDNSSSDFKDSSAIEVKISSENESKDIKSKSLSKNRTRESSESVNEFSSDVFKHTDITNNDSNAIILSCVPSDSDSSENGLHLIKVVDDPNMDIRINKSGYVYNTTSQIFVIKEDDLYVCKLCKKSFKWLHTAEHHVRSKHIQEKPFKCEICGKMFTAAHYLNRHISCVHEEMKFTCQKCGQRFNRRYNLVDHEKTHEGPPHLNCPHDNCFKKFYSKIVLKQHISKSHIEKKIICEKCGKYFRTTTRLKEHQAIHNKTNQ